MNSSQQISARFVRLFRRVPGFAVLMIFAGLVVCAESVQAGKVEVPLVIDGDFIRDRAADALEFDREGAARLRHDECNRVDLADLQVATDADRITSSVSVAAVTGMRVFGDCRGPATWHGRMNLELAPVLEASGLAVRFRPESAELVRADGTPGLMTRPARMLAETLVLPRMERIRIDLESPLAAIDELLAGLLPGAAPAVLERTRIVALDVDTAGLRATLGFQVPAAPVERPPEPALDPSELAQWQRLEDELDGFLTTVIWVLAATADSDELRLELLAVLVDARHSIAVALAEDDPGADPVREVFVSSWDRLRPLMADLELDEIAGLDADLRLAAFIAGGDAIRALDALGPEYGLEITRDGLRRLARMLLAEDAPERFTPLSLEVDPALRQLFGLGRAQRSGNGGLARGLLGWIVPAAHAGDPSPAEALAGLVPRLAYLDDYLELVASLLEQQTGAHLHGGSRVPERLVPRFDPLVRATAWKESCWRQFTGSTDAPQVLRSPIGALGMMQINGRVWRGLYDIDRLADEVDYNVAAGTEILEHYLVDYAIRRAEHEHPGGDDNLIKATYAAYNGGPSHLSRYRRDDTAARLRAIDNEFWRHYTTIKADQWPDIASCYPVGG